MQKIAQIAMTLVLALYAAGSFAQTANATAMTIKMTIAAGHKMAMHDCQNCENDSDTMVAGLTCDTVCTTPLPAVFAASPELVLTDPLPQERPLSETLAIGRTGPPDPFPPRTII